MISGSGDTQMAKAAQPLYVGFKFSPQLEREFQNSLIDDQVWIARVGLILGELLNVIYTFWDALAFDAAFWQVTLLRQVVASGFMFVVIGLTFVAAMRPHMSALVGFTIVGYATFFATINTLEASPYIFIANGTIVVFFPFLFMAGSLPWAIGSSLASSAVFLGIVGAARGLDRSFVLLALLDVGMTLMGIWFALLLEALRRRAFLAGRELGLERQRFRDLLVRILPGNIADRLQRGEKVADRHQNVAVLFADVVGFTALSARHDPDQIVGWLNALFGAFDRIVEQHGLEKIKTVGDAYMAAHGIGAEAADCGRCASAALAMIAEANATRAPDGSPVQIRVGLHVGPCHAGIIGDKRFLYDLWGDTVNVASRMEAASVPDAVLVTDAVRSALQSRFALDPHGQKDIKGKGPMNTWLLQAS
jgi:adenylate cyclase